MPYVRELHVHKVRIQYRYIYVGNMNGHFTVYYLLKVKISCSKKNSQQSQTTTMYKSDQLIYYVESAVEKKNMHFNKCHFSLILN
jgi:hypothetical protein